ncbi:MAG: MATE family efflux transporter [Candidatus Ornithospirochaeta sp.]|nr:MATE family efflux transporter [Sphaerochaetaceae bacterium]MDY5523410.1 MATE family efflux transporter [Candidatus Ornithospirochaeta sp.]
MDIKGIKENKLKTILQFSVPSIIAMLLQTAITITDGYFTGNYVGENALAAINLGLPILYFYLGVGLCIGVGGTVICGRLLGAKEKEKASEVFSQTIVTAVVVCIFTSIVACLLFSPILKVLRADGELSVFFTEYYRIMLFTYPLTVIGTSLGMFIRTDGKPQICMLVSMISCVMNALLDHVMVVRLSMGVQGSAIASFAVQTIGCILQLMYFVNPSRSIRFRPFRFDRAVNKEIFLNGSSEFIGEMASAVSMFAFNYVLMKYVGAEGVAAFTILGFAVYGYSMIAIGFGQGLTPLISVSWGAGEHKTVMELRQLTNRILFVIGALFALFFFFLGKGYARIFGCSDGVADMVSSGFRIYTVTFLFMGYNVISSMYFTSCGDAYSSALISSLRGIILLLGFTFLFSALLGMTGVWISAPATEGITAILSVWLIARQKKKLEGR